MNASRDFRRALARRILALVSISLPAGVSAFAGGDEDPVGFAKLCLALASAFLFRGNLEVTNPSEPLKAMVVHG
ncbi:hypothetical protein [Polyangium sp. 15x6]|uniref:hypothetical protein n=1 Tax=Polyangium sp. 15x6 TaxID=3042687 RepID=UPI00249A3012|nr:hypothetical protein [Polyangium sp. 15x6]MDI3284231.1 hypothetical protein [Polyangium sp. 15x6]